MDSVEIIIDDKPVKAKEGTKILQAALDAGIYIPNLCYIQDAELSFGGCRLCYVDIEGRGPVTSCTQPVAAGMVIMTQTPAVKRLRQTAYKLLIAYHDLDCPSCWKRKKCELLRLSAKVKVKAKTPEDFRRLPTEFLPPDKTNPFIVYDPNRCILCGKCVWVCTKKNGETFIDFAHRGSNTRLTISSNISLMEEKCEDCRECVAICPTAALGMKAELEAVDNVSE